MRLVDVMQIRNCFLDNFRICSCVMQEMNLRRLKKAGQYLHLIDNDDRLRLADDDYGYLNNARTALGIINLFGRFYVPGRDLAVDETMNDFKGRFTLK
jgi:hypothetical protein